MDIKTILITGASKGIGASFSNFLASEGYRIIGIARNKDQLIKTFNSLPNQNLNHDILPIDITDFNLVKEKLSHINLYCLINNAGIAQSNLLHEASLDEINQIMNINLISALNISNTIIPKMILNKIGRIINISSILGLNPLKFVGAYSMSKAALIQMTKSQSIELAKYNILVNAICPGSVNGDRMDRVINAKAKLINSSNKKVRKELESMVSLNTFVEKEDIASMALFLLSDASENVSGQIMTVDGNTERMN